MRTRPQLSGVYVSLFSCTRDSPLIVARIYVHARFRLACIGHERDGKAAGRVLSGLEREGERGNVGRKGERGGGRERCSLGLLARSTFLCWLRRRNIYYPVHGPAGEGWNRRGRGAGKSSRAANCPPSYPPYTLSHTLTVTTLIPLPPWSPPPAGSSHPTHRSPGPRPPAPRPPSSSSLSLGVPRAALPPRKL